MIRNRSRKVTVEIQEFYQYCYEDYMCHEKEFRSIFTALIFAFWARYIKFRNDPLPYVTITVR